MNVVKGTKKTYGLLWARSNSELPKENLHFNMMQEAVGEPIVRGRMGIEVGSGCGYDTYIMAKNNPSVKFVSIDISDGIYKTKERVHELENVLVIKSSALAIPLKDANLDFAYSFGVLHHTTDPKKGLREMARILKKGGPAFLYLYEDHSENIFKYIAVKIISWIRFVTSRIPRRVLYFLAWVVSPFVFIMFTLPSRILNKFKATQHIASEMPFNFGTGPFSLQGSLYDRFGAPIEHRFSRQDIYSIFTECGFCNIHITRLGNTAGWVVWGNKA